MCVCSLASVAGIVERFPDGFVAGRVRALVLDIVAFGDEEGHPAHAGERADAGPDPGIESGRRLELRDVYRAAVEAPELRRLLAPAQLRPQQNDLPRHLGENERLPLSVRGRLEGRLRVDVLLFAHASSKVRDPCADNDIGLPASVDITAKGERNECGLVAPGREREILW